MVVKQNVRFCPEHGYAGPEGNFCPVCGKPLIESDISAEEYMGYKELEEKDPKATKFSSIIQKSFQLGENVILEEFRKGTGGDLISALYLLMWQPTHDDYISEVASYMEDERFADPSCLYLTRCCKEKVDPYLTFDKYRKEKFYSRKLFKEKFLKAYKYGEKLNCEFCKKETDRLFIKIQSVDDDSQGKRAKAIWHAVCDDCCERIASDIDSLKDLTREEKIEGIKRLNTDINVKGAGDMDKIGGIGFADYEIRGFSYDYLLSPDIIEDMEKYPEDHDALKAMMEEALKVRKDLEEI